MFNIGYRAIYQKNIRSAIKEAKKNGFKVLEIHLTSPQFMPFQYSVSKLDSLKDFARKQDIILQVHAPLEQSLIFTNKELRKGAKRQIEEMVKFCKNLGARCLTLHPGRAAIYHTANGKKLKDDNIYSKFYSELFEDSIKHIISIAPKDLFICIENADNFTPQYQKVLDKYLPIGKVFLTWDIRKNYSYMTNKLIGEQWRFVQKNINYVRNLHISGLATTHGNLKGRENKFYRFFDFFSDRDLPIIIEISPLKYTKQAKNIISKIEKKLSLK